MCNLGEGIEERAVKETTERVTKEVTREVTKEITEIEEIIKQNSLVSV